MSQTRTDRPALASIWRVGILSTLVATILNAALFLIGSAASAFPADALTPLNEPLQFAPVIFLTIGGGLLATIGYTVLTRSLSRSQAKRFMIIVAILVLLGMAGMPFSITNAPVMMIVILEVMHLIAALPVLALLRAVR